MGSDGPLGNDRWNSLCLEVKRLVAEHHRGTNFSEDFAVDRICSAFEKLQQQQWGHNKNAASENSDVPKKSSVESSKSGDGGNLVNVRVELAMEEHKLRILQTRTDEVLLQITRASEMNEELKQELEAEKAGRRRESEEQAQQWKEVALKTHRCLANLRAKEQEATQLRLALCKVGNISEACETLIKNLQIELDMARDEKLEARRELDKLSSESCCVETEILGLLAGHRPAAVNKPDILPEQPNTRAVACEFSTSTPKAMALNSLLRTHEKKTGWGSQLH